LEVPLWRILFVYALGVVVIGALIYRLFSLQVVDAQTWLGQAIENYTSEINDPASTGSSCNTSRKSQTLSKVLSERIRIEYEAAGRLPRAENQRRFEALKLEFPELLRRSDFDRLEHVIGALADVEFDMLVEPIRRDGVLNSQATFGLVEVKTSDHRISRSDLFTPQPNVGAMINSFKRLVAFREILRLQNEIQLIAFFPHGIETDAAAELETLGFVVIDGRPFTRQLETHKP
jgi:cell division protein FtsI/penicillin-binding protein 2